MAIDGVGSVSGSDYSAPIEPVSGGFEQPVNDIPQEAPVEPASPDVAQWQGESAFEPASETTDATLSGTDGAFDSTATSAAEPPSEARDLHDTGYQAGIEAGRAAGFQRQGAPPSADDSTNPGYRSGYTEGANQGYLEGWAARDQYDQSFNDGFNAAYEAGKAGAVSPNPELGSGDMLGDGGHRDGVNAGFEAGRAARVSDPANVPMINQYAPANPNGVPYAAGPSNCGPTSVAMLARSMGLGQGLTDAELINQLGQAGGTSASEGTPVNGIGQMASSLGLTSQTQARPDAAWVAQQLKEGKAVVANGDYFSLPTHANANQSSGHYVLITGTDANGNFVMHDPADPKNEQRTLTAGQLTTFIRDNPNGGFGISVGR